MSGKRGGSKKFPISQSGLSPDWQATKRKRFGANGASKVPAESSGRKRVESSSKSKGESTTFSSPEKAAEASRCMTRGSIEPENEASTPPFQAVRGHDPAVTVKFEGDCMQDSAKLDSDDGEDVDGEYCNADADDGGDVDESELVEDDEYKGEKPKKAQNASQLSPELDQQWRRIQRELRSRRRAGNDNSNEKPERQIKTILADIRWLEAIRAGYLRLYREKLEECNRKTKKTTKVRGGKIKKKSNAKSCQKSRLDEQLDKVHLVMLEAESRLEKLRAESKMKPVTNRMVKIKKEATAVLQWKTRVTEAAVQTSIDDLSPMVNSQSPTKEDGSSSFSFSDFEHRQISVGVPDIPASPLRFLATGYGQLLHQNLSKDKSDLMSILDQRFALQDKIEKALAKLNPGAAGSLRDLLKMKWEADTAYFQLKKRMENVREEILLEEAAAALSADYDEGLDKILDTLLDLQPADRPTDRSTGMADAMDCDRGGKQKNPDFLGLFDVGTEKPIDIQAAAIVQTQKPWQSPGYGKYGKERFVEERVASGKHIAAVETVGEDVVLDFLGTGFSRL